MEKELEVKQREVLAYVLAVKEYYGQQAVAPAAVQLELRMSREEAENTLNDLIKLELLKVDGEVPAFSITGNGIKRLTRR